ncbi:hypothetical protein WN943_023353 [Citrus x changshan-huyou]
MEMEMIAEGYFDYLATRSLFQEFQRDEEGIVKRCKMHDIVHDFALFLNKKECAAVEVEGVEEPLLLINTCQEKLRHLMLVLGYEAPSLVSIFNAIKLRSLILFYWIPNLDAMLPVLKGIFDQLTCLRALRIEGTDNWELEEDQTNEILNGVEKLIHLRYLKLNLMNPILSYSNRLRLASSHHLMARGEGIKNLSGHLPRIFYDVKAEDLVPVALWEGVLGFFVAFESILPKVNSDDNAFGGRHTSDMNLAEAKVLDIDFIAEIYDHD